MTAAFFYLFSILTIASALMVIFARNPVHSVLFLILAFVNAAGLFVLLGAEFLAMIFVVMMLDVDFAALRQGFRQNAMIGALIGIVVAIELILVVSGWVQAPAAVVTGGAPIQANVSNTEALGLVLYTKYFYLFQASGLVLLTAMIGAIVLTLSHKPDVKRQVIADQNARTREGAIEIVKAPSRAGV
jgi:NADH-quinone oxidoreductase subunit J